MVIAAFVLSITAVVLLVVLTYVFLWVGLIANKQDTIAKTTREFLEENEKSKNKND